MNRYKIVVFTGAGASAESGIATFRDQDGLWAKYRIEDVCTPEALIGNRQTVIDFYNLRRKELLEREPNDGHTLLAELQARYDISIITQNIDDLHERAGSRNVLHLHGELRKLRSSADPDLIYPIKGWEQKPDTTAEDGSLLRPHVVFFGEPVPAFEEAVEIARQADIFLVAGTSLAVYPAASLVRCISPGIPVWVIDPGNPDLSGIRNPTTFINKGFSDGMVEFKEFLDRSSRI